MTREKLTDGKRIAELLSSEIHGHEREMLGRLTVVDADRDVEPVADGAFGYAIAIESADNDRIAAVYISLSQLHLEFNADEETVQSAAARSGLPFQTEMSTDNKGAIVLVRSGAEVKRVLNVLRAVAEQRLKQAE